MASTLCSLVKYVWDDLSHSYALLNRVELTVRGVGCGIGVAEAGPLRIEGEAGGKVCHLVCEPFGGEARLWNGPNVIPDTLQDGSMEASLWHDLIWTYCSSIAKQTGKSEADILAWSNGILSAAWVAYGAARGKDARGSRVKAYIAYNVCRLGAWIKRGWLRIAGCVAVCALCGGCIAPPDWDAEPGEMPQWSACAQWTTVA